jgi:site-specific recombinase XerD
LASGESEVARGKSVKDTDNLGFSIVTQEDIRKLQTLILSRRDSLILSLLSELGLTISELTELKVSQISLDKNIVSLDDRDIKFSNFLKQRFRAYYLNFNPTEYLFFTRQSPQITSRRVQQLLKDVSHKLNKPITPSNIRKYAISKQLELGVSVEKVKEFSGLKRLDKKQYLTTDEFQKLENSISSERDKLIVRMFYELGITLSQASSLKVRQINLKKKIISIRPDGRSSLDSKEKRFVSISTSLAKSLENFISYSSKIHTISSSKYLFATRQSSKISERRIEQLLQYYSQISSIGKEVTPSILRNSYIAHRISDVGIKQASQELGINLRFYEYGQLSFAASSENKNKNSGGEHARSK